MTHKIMTSLAKGIRDNLLNIINNDYIFLDLPYYTNIGDVLIWKGTEDFLKTLPYKCLYRAAIETYVSQKLSKDTIILLQGGGNFGDIWRRHTDFCLKVIKEFKDNRIIILPQTVYYYDEKVMQNDALEMGKHKNLTICARDNITYKFLNTHFSKNHILLVPDMAFCINNSILEKYTLAEKNKQLFLKRKDKEHSDYDYDKYLDHTNIEQQEWPSMEKDSRSTKLLIKIKKIHNRSKKKNIGIKFSSKLVNYYAYKFYMPGLLKVGTKFLSQYNYIYTTRLHGAILGVLLNKPMTFFDNSYGKNSSFYETWLKESSNINFVKKNS